MIFDYFRHMKTSIIATGASLKNYDFSKIKGHKIAINYAYKYIDYDMLVALDDPKRFGFLQPKLYTTNYWGKKYGHDLTFKKTKFKGIDRNPGCVGACNGSLFAAINLALNMGFKTIDIYGADMAITNCYLHFYSTNPCTTNEANTYKRIFRRHRSHKELFMSQLLPDEKLNWINPQEEQFFNGVAWF